jgi:hypothetical protein
MKNGNGTRTPGRRYRRLVLFIIGYVILFVAGNYAIWKLRTEVLLTKKYDGGDLARMGYLPEVKDYRKKTDDLPRRHLEMRDFHGQPVDILVIGDSFSNGGGEGRNSYFQDYIATINNATVVNVFPYPTGDLIMAFQPVSTLAVLFNSGYLDLLKPKCILIQSAERYSTPRLSLPLRFTATDTVEAIRNQYKDQYMSLDYLPKVGFINDGNFKYLYYNFMYLFSDNAFRRLVYKKQLTRPLFNAGDGKTLIFHGDDLQNLPLATRENIRALNDNLNRLSDILKKKGIKLYFMPVVDKSNLYGDFIVDNRFPRSIFFEELRPLPRRYTLIDTKKVLLERLNRGDKEIFHSDDTHWTWRASQAIFETVSFAGCCSSASCAPLPGAGTGTRSDQSTGTVVK